LLSCTASEAPDLYYLATLIAAYANAHCHADLAQMAEPERVAEVERLKEWFEELCH